MRGPTPSALSVHACIRPFGAVLWSKTRMTPQGGHYPPRIRRVGPAGSLFQQVICILHFSIQYPQICRHSSSFNSPGDACFLHHTPSNFPSRGGGRRNSSSTLTPPPPPAASQSETCAPASVDVPLHIHHNETMQRCFPSLLVFR